MDHHKYDIAIVGMGCAGSHILLQLLENAATRDRKIIILDDYHADSLDKTWSYWEKGSGKWDHLTSHQWSNGEFYSHKVDINFALAPYSYKTIESREFIAFAKAQLHKYPNCTFVNAAVDRVTVVSPDEVIIKTDEKFYKAALVLDSRVPTAFYKDERETTLKQHFLGWKVKTAQESFDPSSFVMMDYRIEDPGTTSFIYVLPTSSNEALIEFTYFSPQLVQDERYELFIKQYIEIYLENTPYEIVGQEQGVVPMTTYRFDQNHNPPVYKIGTAGGWVKASTGYSFKMSEKRAQVLVQNYIDGKPLDQNMQKKRFRFYDEIMLDVLALHNERGHLLFENLYKNNPITRILSFLDEETSFIAELKIMLPLTSMPFIKGFFKRLF